MLRGGAFDSNSEFEDEYDDVDKSDFDFGFDKGLFSFDTTENIFGNKSTLVAHHYLVHILAGGGQLGPTCGDPAGVEEPKETKNPRMFEDTDWEN